jgi:hypothetical protein
MSKRAAARHAISIRRSKPRPRPLPTRTDRSNLALGEDAFGVMRKKIVSLRQDIAAWEATSTSAAFPQAPDPALT